VLQRGFEVAAANAGQWLACRPGCAECCFGPFPITRLDVRRLRIGLSLLGESDPRRALAVRRRAEQAVAVLAEGFPGDPVTGRLTGEEPTLDRFFERHGSLPCPALDPGTQRCDLYAWRPVSCRTYGPPTRFGDERSPPCRLCFVDASAESIEASRMVPDRDGQEQRILAGMGVLGGEEWETLIAFALKRGTLLD
jgi:Fe-S-cluster containining protein